MAPASLLDWARTAPLSSDAKCRIGRHLCLFRCGERPCHELTAAKPNVGFNHGDDPAPRSIVA